MKGIVHSNTYYTDRKPIHFFKIFHGFGISEHILDSLPANVEWIVFRYHGKKERADYGIERNKVRSIGTIFFDKEDKQFVINIDDMKKVVR